MEEIEIELLEEQKEQEIELAEETSNEQEISLENEPLIYGIEATGELVITTNGVFDVSRYASVKVIVSDNTGEIDTSPILDNAILGTMILW